MLMVCFVEVKYLTDEVNVQMIAHEQHLHPLRMCVYVDYILIWLPRMDVFILMNLQII